ncbi:caleosin domain containing [Haematococcus lacustris]|uniref:Caleosin domain containing n=1 Tax=Haematococcus lacustris TaxID=44745 RepID=A0A699YWV8_HAELA|nr:caleosin domain containing [Haematococcus lacustris]
MCLSDYIKNAHRGKHGSDTGVYDTEGRFVPQKFEEIFSKYDKGNKGGLDLSDIRRMISGNSLMGDFAGWWVWW